MWWSARGECSGDVSFLLRRMLWLYLCLDLECECLDALYLILTYSCLVLFLIGNRGSLGFLKRLRLCVFHVCLVCHLLSLFPLSS